MLSKGDLEQIGKIVNDAVDLGLVQISKILIRIEERIDKIETRLDKIEARLDTLEKRLLSLEIEVKDIKRRLIDLEHDTPTDSELKKIELRVTKLEKSVGFTS